MWGGSERSLHVSDISNFNGIGLLHDVAWRVVTAIPE
jgi:hypothetical protein